jgi:hypothetical protein
MGRIIWVWDLQFVKKYNLFFLDSVNVYKLAWKSRLGQKNVIWFNF